MGLYTSTNAHQAGGPYGGNVVETQVSLKESPNGSDGSTPQWSERTKFFPPPREGATTKLGAESLPFLG